MTGPTLRAAYGSWPRYNRALRDVVSGLTEDDLAIRTTPERWPLWATIGHLACQRVSGLCGIAGEPGAESTPFPDALYRCPGDEYLEPVMTREDLLGAIDTTFAIVDRCLDGWTASMLEEEIVRTFPDETIVRTRGDIIERAYAHDVYHLGEVNEILTRAGVPQLELWG